MPLWLAPLLGGIAGAMSSFVGRVLLALSMTYVSYSGLSVGFDAIKTIITTNLTGLPAGIAGLLGYLWVDKALTLIFSSFAALLALKLAGSTTITRLIVKK